MSAKTLDDISYQVDFDNLGKKRPKFKLLLVKNDKKMQVLENQALPQQENDWKK